MRKILVLIGITHLIVRNHVNRRYLVIEGCGDSQVLEIIELSVVFPKTDTDFSLKQPIVSDSRSHHHLMLRLVVEKLIHQPFFINTIDTEFLVIKRLGLVVINGIYHKILVTNILDYLRICGKSRMSIL